MLMFFTLGSSMVGDVCDEDELNTGTRSEGTYYSVFWWFIKMGTAFASFVMGALLVYTSFDERQNVLMDALGGNIAVLKADADAWAVQQVGESRDASKLTAELDKIADNAGKLRSHLERRLTDQPEHVDHIEALLKRLDSVDQLRDEVRQASAGGNSAKLLESASEMLEHSAFLRRQSPKTLFRLRVVEIGLPLVLCVASILLTLRYPLTEARCYEIKEALKKRRAELAT
jgi:Na+/melibiose symporter-like transporter